MIKHFDTNTVGRDFVVGDIHGCTATFHSMLQQIGFDKSVDRMFSVGDLIDRGPDSPGALALLNEPWFHAVRGNHEDILLIITEQDGDWDWWVQNGGAWARGRTKEELAEYSATIHALPLAISVGKDDKRFNVIHAEFYGSDKDLDTSEFDNYIAQQIMWGRTLIRATDESAARAQNGLSTTYCGHTVIEQIQQHGQQVYIDTGAFVSYWGKADAHKHALTIIEPATNFFWRCNSIETR